ncbi:hypothetical protein Tco_0746428 [Tanacetum coccineum]
MKDKINTYNHSQHLKDHQLILLKFLAFPMKERVSFPIDGPYQTNLSPIEDIISSIRVGRDGQVRRIRHEEEIDVLEYQVLTREIKQSLKPLEEIIQENVFCLGGNRDHVPACLCFMLYCVVHSEKFNLAYYMAK